LTAFARVDLAFDFFTFAVVFFLLVFLATTTIPLAVSGTA
jgi:hypothetical protein